MKKKYLVFFSLAVAFMAGCADEKEMEPTLEKVTPATITTVAAGETIKVTLESNTDWTASVTSGKEAGWVTIEGGSGEGNGEFSVVISAFEGFGEGRDTSIDIVAGIGGNSKKYTLAINQTGIEAALSIDPTSHGFGPHAGAVTVNVTSNGLWTAEVADASSNPWCTLENPEGNGNGGFVINVQENPAEGIRNATVKVTMGGEEADVTISQTGHVFTEGAALVSPLTMDNEFEISMEGDWTASSEDPWIDVTARSGQGAGTLKFKSLANADDITASRTGTIAVSSRFETLSVSVTQIPMAVYTKHTIGGVEYELYWSTLLLGEKGEFMPMPDERGYLYQFNRMVAYSPFDPCTPEFNIERIKEVDTDWQPENNPCPEGWRMPHRMEAVAIHTLETKVAEVRSGDRDSRCNGFFVSRDEDSLEEATLYDMKGCLFFPAAKIRDARDGAFIIPNSTYFVEDTETATFWTTTEWQQNMLPGQTAFAITYGHTNKYGLSPTETGFSKNNGCPVRCVKDVE